MKIGERYETLKYEAFRDLEQRQCVRPEYRVGSKTEEECDNECHGEE